MTIDVFTIKMQDETTNNTFNTNNAMFYYYHAWHKNIKNRVFEIIQLQWLSSKYSDKEYSNKELQKEAT